MGRFSPDNSIEGLRFGLQGRRCASCGKEIEWKKYGRNSSKNCEAHHIDGNSRNNDIDNCACVCINCHLYIAHSGHWSSNYVAPDTWYHLLGKWTVSEMKWRRRIILQFLQYLKISDWD